MEDNATQLTPSAAVASDESVVYSGSTTEEECDGSLQHCNVLNLDKCRLTEIKDAASKVECLYCKSNSDRTVQTNLKCINCDTPCCLECYDLHRREQLFKAVSSFEQQNDIVKAPSDSHELGAPVNELSHQDTTMQPNFQNLIGEAGSSRTQSKSNSDRNESTSSCSGINNQQLEILEQSLTFDSVKLAVALLKRNYGVIAEVMFSTENRFKCFYFQDSFMKDYFNFYPHRLCINVLGSIPNLDVVLYLFVVEDADGHGEIISTALINSEDQESMTWLLSMFKKHNPRWRAVKLLIVDSCIRNQELIRNSFPEASSVKSHYHISKTFKRDLECHRNSAEISPEHNLCATKLFHNMVFASTEMEYNLLYQQLLTLHKSVLEYFETVWHPIRHEWRIRIEFHQDILFSLNTFLFFLDRSVRPVLCLPIGLCDFIKKFFFMLKLLRTERKNEILAMTQTDQLSLYSKFTPQFIVTSVLMPNTAAIVNRELDASAEVNINSGVLLENYIFYHSGATAVASSTSCTCKFFLLTSLPCYHIFAVRNVFSLPLFDVNLCCEYWTKKYYFNAYKSLEGSLDRMCKPLFLQNVEPSSCPSMLIDKMLPMLMNCSQDIYEQRLDVLKSLVSSWNCNEEIFLQFDGPEGTDWQNVEMSPHDVSYASLVVKEELEMVPEIGNAFEQQPSSSADASNVESIPIVEKPFKPSFLLFETDFGQRFIEGKYINFIYLTNVICNGKDTCIDWLRYMDFLPSHMNCPSCQVPMQNRNEERLSDGAVWICKHLKGNRKTCAKRCSVRKGTWLEGTNLTLEQILSFIYMWLYEYGQQQIVPELGISAATYTVWDKSFRRICKSAMQYAGPSESSQVQLKDEAVMGSWRAKNSGRDIFVAFLFDAKLVYERDNEASAC